MGRAAGKSAVGFVGLGQCVGGVETDERADLAVYALDSVEAGLGDITRRDLALGQFRRQFGNGELVEHDKSASRRLGAETGREGRQRQKEIERFYNRSSTQRAEV